MCNQSQVTQSKGANMNKKMLLTFLIGQTLFINLSARAEDLDEVTPYMGKGTSTLQGQAFMRQKGGGVVTCAGNIVYLAPSTPYYWQKKLEAMANNNYVIDGKFKTAVREATCDAQGSFTFSDLPLGSTLGWDLITKVEWDVAGKAQGGVLLESYINLKESAVTKIIVTR